MGGGCEPRVSPLRVVRAAASRTSRLCRVVRADVSRASRLRRVVRAVMSRTSRLCTDPTDVPLSEIQMWARSIRSCIGVRRSKSLPVEPDVALINTFRLHQFSRATDKNSQKSRTAAAALRLVEPPINP